MALSTSYKSRIISYLPADYRERYEAGEFTDDQLLQFARLRGIQDPAKDPRPSEASRRSNTPSALEQRVTAERARTRTEPEAEGLSEAARRPRRGGGNPVPVVLGGIQSILGGAEQELGAAQYTAADKATSPLEQGLGAALRLDPTGGYITQLLGTTYTRAGGEVPEALTREATPEQRQRALDSAAGLMRRGDERLQRVDQQIAEIDNPAAGFLAQAGSDFLRTPVSTAASLPGGPFAAIPAASAYNQEYARARMEGLSPEAADRRARAMASAEGLISAVPTGRFGKALMGREMFDTVSQRILGDTVKTAAKESVSEGVTTLAQAGINEGFARFGTEEERTYAEGQRSLDLWQDVRRSMAAGGFGGAAIQAPSSYFQVTAEAGRRAADLERGDARYGQQARAAGNKRIEERRTEQYYAEQERRQQVSKDLAWNAAEAGTQQDPQRIEDEKEAAFRTNETLNRVREQAQAAPDNAMAQAMAGAFENAGPVTAEQVAAEREAAANDTRAQQQKAEADAAKAQQDAAKKKYTDEARKLLKKKQDEAVKKALSKHAAARRKNISEFLKQTEGMDDAARAEEVGRLTSEWDAANPKPTRDTLFPPKPTATTQAQPEATPAPVQQPAAAPQATTPPPAQADTTTQEQVMAEEDIRKFAGLGFSGAQESNANTANPTTSADVITGLKKRIGSSRAAATIGKLIADGRLVVVDNAQQIPGNEGTDTQMAGAYDGDIMYLNASMLDPDNPEGSLMVVAAHEAKHAADVSGAGRATMGHFIGDEANRRIIGKIVDASNNGDTIAAEALADGVAAAAQYRDDLATMEKIASLETPAYYVSKALENRASSPTTRRILGDIVSSVRDAYNRRFNDGDVNLKDVAYLANKLTETIAASNDRISGDMAGPIMPMVVGPESSQFEDRKARGLTYTDVDGFEKTLLSDAEAELNKKTMMTLENGTRTTLKELMTIPALEGGMYDLLGDTPVYVTDTVEGDGGAGLHPSGYGLAMYLHPSAVDKGRSDPEFLRTLVLHETQHLVQFVEGWAKGGNPRDFLPVSDRRVLEKYEETRARLSKAVKAISSDDGEVAQLVTSPAIRSALKGAVEDFNNDDIGLRELADEVREYLRHPKEPSKPEYEDIIKEFNTLSRLFQAYSPRIKAINERLRDAHQDYLDLLGEKESRFTESTARTKQAELDIMVRPKYDGRAIVIFEVGKVDNKQSITLGYTPGASKEAARNAWEEAKLVLTGKSTRFTKNVLKGQVSGFGVLGRELGSLKELAEGEAASIAYAAESIYHNLRYGIEKLARKRKVSNDKVREEVNKVLEEAEKIEDPERRRDFVGRYVKANPELRPLVEAIDAIADQTKAIIKARVADPRPLTDEEKRKFSGMIKNRYTYFTRTYAAFQGNAGRTRNRRLKADALLAERQLAKGQKMSDKYKHAYNIYKRAVDFIIENDLLILDPTMLSKQELDRIRYLYELHVGNPDLLRKQIDANDDLKNKNERDKAFRAAAEAAILEASAKTDKAAMEREARFIVDGMLNLNDGSNPIVNYYRGMKEDRSILQKRQMVPERIRELYGEVTDLPTMVAITLAKQGELAARMRMLQTIYDNGAGKWFVTPETFRSSDQYANFTTELSGDSWGPLTGMRLLPEIAAALNDNLDVFTPLTNALAQSHATVDRVIDTMDGKIGAGIRGLGVTSKLAQIVLSPFNIIMNYAGSFGVLAQNGLVMPEDFIRAKQAAVVMLHNQISPGGVQGRMKPMARDPDLELFLKYGLLDSAVGQELRSTPSKYLKQLVLDLEAATTAAAVAKVWRAFGQKVGRGKDFAVEAFALSDAWVKPAIFLSRVRFLEKVNKAEGNGWTREDIEKMAATMTKDTTITFQRAAPLVKAFERFPLAWFGNYIQGVYRSLMYSTIQSYKDLAMSVNAKTEEGRLLYAMEGAKRLAGVSAATFGMSFATKAVSEALNGDDDEDYLTAAKKLLFTEGRYGHGIYLGKNAQGYPVFMRLSRIDPNGPVNDALRIAFSDEEPAAKAKALVEHFKDLWIKPRIVEDTLRLVQGMMPNTETKDRQTKLERLFPTTTSYMKAFVDGLPGMDFEDGQNVVTLLDGFVPGAMNAFDQDLAKPRSDQDAFEQVLATSIWMSGGRLDVADPEQAAFRAGAALETLQKTGRTRVADALTTSGPQRAVEVYANLRDAERQKYRELREVYDSMLGMGMSPRQAMAVLKDNKVQEQDIAVIMRGRIPNAGTGLFNEDSINKWADFNERRLTPEERETRAEERKQAIEKLRLLIEKENK